MSILLQECITVKFTFFIKHTQQNSLLTQEYLIILINIKDITNLHNFAQCSMLMYNVI